jgi:DnaJ-class molecular chaperone
MTTHYEVLGIDANADETEIKKAYRSLSFKHHPDRSQDPDSSNIMQRINSAYEVLREPQSRQQYDAELNGMHSMHANPFMGNMGGMPGMGGINIFDMLFSQMAGNMGNMGGINIEIMHNGNGTTFIRRHVGKPETIVKNVSITLEQAYTGFVATVEIDRWNMRQQDGLKINEIESIQVKIPAGVETGQSILLEGIGNSIEGNDGNSIKGDVKVCVSVQSHAIFIRQGSDICFKKTLSLKEALCGTQFQFEHLNGKMLTLNVTNAIIFPGGKKVFAGMGMPKMDGTVGNLILEFDVQFPASLTQEQKDALSNIL